MSIDSTAQTNHVLVTGGAGYIGSHACKALARHGFIPVCYDNFSRGHDWAVKWGPLEEGNILDSSRLNAVLQRYHPCAVMHFAALAYVGESINEPSLYYHNNVAGSLNLLQSLQLARIKHFIFSSSCSTYGAPEEIPITETHPQNPINPYGASKLMIERMLTDFATAYGLHSVSLRYFNAAGADPEGEIGEYHEPETHLIPLCLKVASGDLPLLEIYGNDYDTPDGTCIRDYIHVTDLAEAHVRALQYLIDGGTTDAFNLGNEQGFSVSEIIKTAESVTRKPIKTRILPRRTGDPACLIADTSKIKRILSWKPGFPEINIIIKTAWDWQLKNLSEYNYR